MQVNSLPTELSGKHPPPHRKKKNKTEKWTKKKRQSKGDHRSKTRDEALQSERTV